MTVRAVSRCRRQRGFVCVAMSSRTQVGQWHSGLCKPVLGHVVATVPPSRSSGVTSRSARGACTSYNARDPEKDAPSGTGRRPSEKRWHVRAQADSPSRHTSGDGASLTKESGHESVRPLARMIDTSSEF